jgi:hypothetical protein
VALSGQPIQIFYEFFHTIRLFYPPHFETSQINKLEAFAVAISTRNSPLIHSLFPLSPQNNTQHNVLDLTAKHIILCIQLIDYL